MDKEVKYIRFDFENVEHITISIDDILYMEIRDITETHRKFTLEKTIMKTNHCNYLKVCVNKKARVGGFCLLSRPYLARLINYNDLCSISYLNEKKQIIMSIDVPYKTKYDSVGEENLNESIEYDKDGNIKITVDGNK